MTNSRPRSFAVIPAAGRSERMGRPKLLLPWRAGQVIDAVAAAWRVSGVDRAVAVVRADDLPLLDAARRAGLEVVAADPPPADMKESVLRGLQWIAARFEPAPGDCFLVAPADAPLLSAAVVQELLAARRVEEPAILVPRCQGRRGHPVLFPWPLFAEIPSLAADRGLDQLLDRFPTRFVETRDERILLDMDTAEDYRRLVERDAGLAEPRATQQ